MRTFRLALQAIPRGFSSLTRYRRFQIASVVVIFGCALVSGTGAISEARRPVVIGPRTTTNTNPTYKFRYAMAGVKQIKITFHCSFDSKVLHKCGRTVRPKLKAGKHVLRVRATGPGGIKSALAVVRITVKKKGKKAKEQPVDPEYLVSCQGVPSGGSEVTIRSPDGSLSLYGIRFGSGASGVILAPEGDGSVCGWASAVQPILDRHLQVLIYTVPPGFDPVTAAVAAASTLRGAGVGNLFVAGSSLGAGAALDSVSRLNPRPRGVIFLAGQSNPSRLEIVGTESSIAFLYLTAENDGWVASSNTKELMAATSSSDKKLVVYPGTQHGLELLSPSTPTGEQIKAEIAGWLAARSS